MCGVSSDFATLARDGGGCVSLHRLRKNAITAITSQSDFGVFYERLRALREYHAKFPETPEPEDSAMTAAVPHVEFTGEEAFGKFVDMHSLHERYINMEQFRRETDYIAFLTTFHQFHTVPRSKKNLEFVVFFSPLNAYLSLRWNGRI